MLTRNENYWKPGLPYLDGINMRIISELNTVVRTVVAGETDIAINLQAPQKAVADRSPNVVAKAAPSLVLYGAFINYGTPAARRRARPAGAQLRDQSRRDQQDRGASASARRRARSCRRSTGPAIRRRRITTRYDPDKAKKLLAEAGHPNGIEIEIDRLGRPARDAAPGSHHLAARQGRHPRQADGAGPAAGGAGLHDREEGRDVHQPVVGLSRSEPALRGAVRQDALRNAGGVELPGFRELLDATMEAPDQPTRKAAFVKLQRFVRRERAADGAVHFAGGRTSPTRR